MNVCRFCQSPVNAAAVKCPHCQEWIKRGSQSFNPGIAVLLSLIIPGTGMLYRGKVVDGLIWMVIVPAAWIAAISFPPASDFGALILLPPVILHLASIVRSAI